MKNFTHTQEGFKIYFEALPEDLDLKDFLPEETEESLKEIENTNQIFCAKVSAEREGIELGNDYLGECIYEDEEDFYTKYKNDGFTDMVDNAINEAKETIKRLTA